MHALAAGLSYCDLNFQGHERIVATAVLDSPDGCVLIDPGPSSTLATLDRTLQGAGISSSDITTLVLTHIHLDHAGAVGTIVQRRPTTRVYVHQTGAPHLVDPARLVASATRLYADRMAELWGEVLPVPARSLNPLAGGERLEVGGRRLEVLYTPGHASHHVSYFDSRSGVAFVGDTAGIKRRESGYELPPTPPPDIDLELWRASLAQIGRWEPETLFLTHFGPSSPSRSHLAAFGDHLEWLGELARTAVSTSGAGAEGEQWFVERLRHHLRTRMSEAEAIEYEVAGRFDLSYRGLARYWSKRAPV
jgi:glyoxylase-like metal-dependent hydrolase (beta-lactamase superfamily II)